MSHNAPGDDVSACFSQSYASARTKFLAAAEAARLSVHSHIHPMPGRDGETLAMDVVRDGPIDTPRVLLVSSGCHGVEGFCGSGIQVALLRDDTWRKKAHDAGVAIVYLHALNPHGFSWWRRTTHENIDLNRNFHDFNQPLPQNSAYDEVADVLVPPVWPPRWREHLAVLGFMLSRGKRGMQTAVSTGQYSRPQGLFFGGHGPSWSHLTLRKVMREQGAAAKRLGWIDLHTGLGPSGVGEPIYAGRDDPAAIVRARAWWGKKVTSIYDGTSVSAELTGLMWNAVYEECPQAEYTGIALEFGTQPMLKVLNALRADQWLQNHPQHQGEHGARIKQQIRDAFYTDTDEWKQRVLAQARDAAQQAVAGLSSH